MRSWAGFERKVLDPQAEVVRDQPPSRLACHDIASHPAAPNSSNTFREQVSQPIRTNGIATLVLRARAAPGAGLPRLRVALAGCCSSSRVAVFGVGPPGGPPTSPSAASSMRY